MYRSPNDRIGPFAHLRAGQSFICASAGAPLAIGVHREMKMLNNLKRFVLGPGKSSASTRDAVAVEHTLLGVLTPDSRMPHVLAGLVSYEGCPIEISIDADGGTMDEALILAEEAVRSLSNIEMKARMLLAADCLEGYNSDWRFGETELEDGSTTRFEKPRLTAEEFCASVQFKTIDICGKDTVTLWYGDGDMFWGHDLFVTSFDGSRFTNTHVSMAG